MNKTGPYFHKWRRACVVAYPFLQTAGWLWSSTPPQPQDSLTGQDCWGSSPLWERDLYASRMFVSEHGHEVCLSVCLSVCVCKLCGRCMTLLNLHGLRSDLEHHLAWKTEGDTHTKHTHWSWFLHAQSVYEQANEWDPISPKKKKKTSTVDNATLLVPTCTFWTRQPALFWFTAWCKPAKPISAQRLLSLWYSLHLFSPVQPLIWVFFPAKGGF